MSLINPMPAAIITCLARSFALSDRRYELILSTRPTAATALVESLSVGAGFGIGFAFVVARRGPSSLPLLVHRQRLPAYIWSGSHPTFDQYGTYPCSRVLKSVSPSAIGSNMKTGMQKALEVVGGYAPMARALGIDRNAIRRWHNVPDRWIIKIEHLTCDCRGRSYGQISIWRHAPKAWQPRSSCRTRLVILPSSKSVMLFGPVVKINSDDRKTIPTDRPSISTDIP